MDTIRIQHTARIEQELSRLRTARPEMESRIEKAEHLIVTQLSVPAHVRPIKAAANGSVHSYKVRSGSRLSKTYTVSRASWTCDCPATKTCYHVIGCWLLERASLSRRHATATPKVGHRHVPEGLAEGLSTVTGEDHQPVATLGGGV